MQCRLLAHLRHAAISDMSPQCEQKRTLRSASFLIEALLTETFQVKLGVGEVIAAAAGAAGGEDRSPRRVR
jgi:hypothetical protein